MGLKITLTFFIDLVSVVTNLTFDFGDINVDNDSISWYQNGVVQIIVLKREGKRNGTCNVSVEKSIISSLWGQETKAHQSLLSMSQVKWQMKKKKVSRKVGGEESV